MKKPPPELPPERSRSGGSGRPGRRRGSSSTRSSTSASQQDRATWSDNTTKRGEPRPNQPQTHRPRRSPAASSQPRPRRSRTPRHERARVFRPFSADELAQRAMALPVISYPDLPVSARREDIAQAIRDHQVVIVSGETGSGKTTQLPKICLQLGRGVAGMIGHTQPRRIAARAVADRIAEEMGQSVGREVGHVVGYQVRFTDEVGPTTLVKLMTDGILLAEIQSDPLLRRYDTLIIDEAHERSLNIDFILGYVARLLPARPDLKVIITSATIDSQRFAEHFGRWQGPRGTGVLLEAAPVIEVSGRTYPVEIRYRPLSAALPSRWTSSSEAAPGQGSSSIDEGGAVGDGFIDAVRPDVPHSRVQHVILEDPDDDLPTLGYGLGEDIDQEAAICQAVDELADEGPGDILVFLPGERDIRETEQALIDHLGARALTDPRAPHTPDAIEILPLYARLTAAEQHRIFEPHTLRRVVLATNVAETSLTVPGVRYVIDPGLARISRYSNRTKVQRLPIEPISQASANQRAGRSGRVADGVAIRLYGHADFDSRPEFTEPEILRTSLASVILQMAALGLGAVADFPFLDPPDSRAVRDGIQLLTEIGALEADPAAAARSAHRLTAIGRDLAVLPIDPRLGRMLIEGDANGCASEVLVIVAALSIQDVRERPLDHQQAADAAHARFTDPSSDFITYLNLWRYLNVQSRDLSGSAFRRLCRAEFLHYLRFREWRDVVNQLRQMARPLDLDLHSIGIPSSGQVAHAATTGGISNAAARAVVAYTDSANTVDADEIHRSLLGGLLSNLGNWNEANRDYSGTRGTRFTIWPGSGLARSHPAWVMTAELVETSRLFARTVARIRPEWIEPAAGPLLRRVYSEPYWSSSKGAAMAKEKVLLYGLTLVADRPVLLGRLDVTFGGAGSRRLSVGAPGTLAGIAQGLRSRPSRERDVSASTTIADALADALASFGMSQGDSPTTSAPPAPGGEFGFESSTDPQASAITPGDLDPSELDEGGSPAASVVEDGAITARELAREMFIRHALVRGEWRERHRFATVNEDLLEQAREAEKRSRTHGLVADEESLVAFFDDLIPDTIVSAAHFGRWWKNESRTNPDLLTYPMSLLLPRGTGSDSSAFPDHWEQGDVRLPLSYRFTPGSARDGVTVTVPIEVLPRISDQGADWLVPGMLEELSTEMIRALPKAKRRLLAPAPEVGRQVSEWITRMLTGEDENTPPLQAPAHTDAHATEPDSADPRSLDAAMDRLAAWGARSGQAVRRQNAPAALPDAEEAPQSGHASKSQARTATETPAAIEPDTSAPSTAPATPGTGSRDSSRPPFAQAFARAVAHVRGVDLSAGDLSYAHDHLPSHLHITFVVINRQGKEVGAGPSLRHLQRTLASQADSAVRSAVRGAVAEAFADAAQRKGSHTSHTAPDQASAPSAPLTSQGSATRSDAPAVGEPASSMTPQGAQGMVANDLHLDALTAFPAMPLARAIESRGRDGMALRGFPTLVPQGSATAPAAGVRVMANPAEADRLHRQGLARLILVRVRLANARVTTRWTGREALMLAASPYPDTTALVADAQLASALSIVDELSGPGGPESIRTADAFERVVARARDVHEDRVYEILGHVVRSMEALSLVQAAVREHPQVSLRDVVADVQAMTATLIYEGFVSATPQWALAHVARYVRAGAVRIERAAQGAKALERDQVNANMVGDVSQAVEEARSAAAERPFDAAASRRLEDATWAVQELRVSAFAQQLGTPHKVSAKRILGMVRP